VPPAGNPARRENDLATSGAHGALDSSIWRKRLRRGTLLRRPFRAEPVGGGEQAWDARPRLGCPALVEWEARTGPLRLQGRQGDLLNLPARTLFVPVGPAAGAPGLGLAPREDALGSSLDEGGELLDLGDATVGRPDLGQGIGAVKATEEVGLDG